MSIPIWWIKLLFQTNCSNFPREEYAAFGVIWYNQWCRGRHREPLPRDPGQLSGPSQAGIFLDRNCWCNLTYAATSQCTFISFFRGWGTGRGPRVVLRRPEYQRHWVWHLVVVLLMSCYLECNVPFFERATDTSRLFFHFCLFLALSIQCM